MGERQVTELLADFEHAVHARTMSEVLRFIESYAEAPDTPPAMAEAARCICDGLVLMYGEPTARRPRGVLRAAVSPPPTGERPE